MATPIRGEPDLLEGSDFFEWYGIPRVQIRAYPAATHLAEKLHAYTLPRDRGSKTWWTCP